MRKQDWVWQCEHKGCGHKWLASGVEAPEQCAKCKKRGWHTKNTTNQAEATPDEIHAFELPKPDMQALRGIVERIVERGEYSQE